MDSNYKPAYQFIAQCFDAYLNCIKSGNKEWEARHKETIEQICKDVFPHGSGLDGDHCTLDFDRSKPNKLVFRLDFHHMNENGYYDGWSEHELIVTPSLANGYDMRITGRNRNDIKEYLYEVCSEALDEKLD